MTENGGSSVRDNKCRKFRKTFGKLNDKIEVCCQFAGCEAWFHITCIDMNEKQQKNLERNHENLLTLPELLCDDQMIVRSWLSQTDNADATSHRNHNK